MLKLSKRALIEAVLRDEDCVTGSEEYVKMAEDVEKEIRDNTDMYFRTIEVEIS